MEKIFCKDCTNLIETNKPYSIYWCKIKTEKNTWLEPMVVNIPPEDKNKNNNCEDFKEKNYG
jgi:hypothetical protein